MGKKIDIEELAENDELSESEKAGLVGGAKGVFDPNLVSNTKQGVGEDLRPPKRDNSNIIGSASPSDI